MADSPQPNMAFTKAAFMFRDGLDKSRATKKSDQIQVAVKAIEVPTPEPTTAPPSPTRNELAHQARHQRRIRIARTIQHLLTSILSIVVAFMQGKVFVLYQRTKNVPGAWPINANLVPTLMLFATALAALTIDLCALVAYIWPKTGVGRRAFAFAHSAYAVYTTIKSIAYAFSAVVCKTGMDHGTSSGNLDDLWSWTCSPESNAQSAVNQNSSNCTGFYVAWYFALANIGIEILGVIINQVAKQDAIKFKTQGPGEAQTTSDLEKHDDADSDTKPLLPSSPDVKSNDVAQAKSPNTPNDDYGSKFDEMSDELDGQLNDSLPKMPGSQ